MKNLSASMLACTALTLSAAAQEPMPAAEVSPRIREIALRDREWFAYRGYHDLFIRFRDQEQAARYPLLQLRLKVWPLKPDLPMEDLTLQLVSASVDRTLAVDPVAGIELPLSRQVYEEDGILRLNRAKGSYTLSTQYSVLIRPDGMYTPQWLQSACEQGLAVKKTFNLSHFLASLGKSCAGITFYFPASDQAASVAFRDVAGTERSLPMERAPYFGHSAPPHVALVRYKFRDWPPQGWIVTSGRPKVIDFILE